eukprot:TRINITY_DN13135_c0_g1_i1.p1 TRINITY_DN13135_c0_g1~~TRINITY_DN13135_c0_g1_i1.p1  ORF type:complete len:396 (+),score=46.63 TRINITY_DN13135_c0_g1_i1:107-1189(+)
MDDDGFSALHWASHKGHLETVKWLLTNYPETGEQRTKRSSTPFLLAAWQGRLEVVKWWVKESGFDVIHEANKAGLTGLLFAAHSGHLPVVQWLIECAGCDAKKQMDDENCTVLLTAARDGHLNVVKWLLAQGHSDPKEKDTEGYTALLLAAATGQVEVARWLVKEGWADVSSEKENDGFNALLVASAGGQLAVVQWLVQELGQDPETSLDGITALAFAAQGKNGYKVVDWLLRQDTMWLVDRDIAEANLVVTIPTAHKEVMKALALNGWVDAEDALVVKKGQNIVFPKWTVQIAQQFPAVFQFFVGLAFWCCTSQPGSPVRLLPELVGGVVQFLPAHAFAPSHLKNPQENHTAPIEKTKR